MNCYGHGHLVCKFPINVTVPSSVYAHRSNFLRCSESRTSTRTREPTGPTARPISSASRPPFPHGFEWAASLASTIGFHALAATNPYRVWIDEYAGMPYQEVAAKARAHLDLLADLYATPAREAILSAQLNCIGQRPWP